MCCLLRHPARVPSLFSGTSDAEPRRRGRGGWRRLAPAGFAHPAAAWAAVVMVELPLVKAGMAMMGLGLAG